MRKGLKGASFQWSGKSVITRAYAALPDMDFACVELECRNADNSWDDAMYLVSNMNHYYRNGSRACVYWNMALENEGMSSWEWCQNSLISIKDGDYKLNNDYYSYKHFAHFVKPGAKVLKTHGMYCTCATFFQNPDESIVGIMLNPFEIEMKVTVLGKNFVFASHSINTICF